ncbi:MFS transporter [Bradyrhizobium sp. LHD-71]|uniref:MFS transporter n=1 Tax=Bradyrhizobium sp. LHD-71 TaxID=3072141 RepID=UPI00280D2798|nr:MFS transporter [Bradyrhizobium sp. LHD-71]MDQ8727145.1 MFS transporter [Bradyrhizobium sp. LHD-71]
MADIVAGSDRTEAQSELRSLTVISIAHWYSHYVILVLPMLFPFLKERLGVGFVELGFALTVFAVVSGLTQAPLGYVVDRFGARRLLTLGVCLGGAAFVLLGMNLSYPWLIASAALLGLANSVYHPSDYALLAANIDGKRIGRAFSIHTFSGFLGGAVAPAIVALLVAMVGGAGALMASGAIGFLVALLIVAFPIPEASAATASANGADADAGSSGVLTPAILMLAVFFMLLGLSNSGISTFGVVSLMTGYGLLFSTANIALTAYLGASAVGVLAGGFLADRTHRHGDVAAACFAANVVIIVLIALLTPHPALLIAMMTLAGFLGGVIAPSRDMLVRKAAPPGAAGRAFGIVSTGFNMSGIISPLLFGWIMDQSMPRGVFWLAACFMALTVLLALVTERRRPATEAA